MSRHHDTNGTELVPADVDSAYDKPCLIGGLLVGLFICVPLWALLVYAWRVLAP